MPSLPASRALGGFPLRLRYVLAAGAAAAIAVAAAAAPAEATTYTVANVSDVNAGSLRRAIESAEQHPGRDTIRFDIPGGGGHKITLVAALPVLSDPVTIKGYSQPGSVEGTDDTPAQPMIEIDAGDVGRGLEIVGDEIKVGGLAIHSAQEYNIYIEGGDENTIAGNHLGTNLAGDAIVPAPPPVHNVQVHGSDNLIGGPTGADRNVISSRALAEVDAKGGPIEVENNRIGTNAEGSADLGYGTGVWLGLGAGESVVRDNLISGLEIGVDVGGDHNTVVGNRVGTNADGTAAIPNSVGINVEGGDYNTIGGTEPGEGNLISGNAYEGLQLEHGDDEGLEDFGPAVGNRVLGNLIGVDVSGEIPLRNDMQGIALLSELNTIGGHEAGEATSSPPTASRASTSRGTATACSATRSAPTWTARSGSETAATASGSTPAMTTRSATGSGPR